MARLNQIIALEKGTKSRTFSELSDAHQQVQKTPLLAGISRAYTPNEENGEQLPPESTRVQLNADAVVARVADILTGLFDVTASKDWTNCRATADIVVEGNTLLSGVPATYLLFLEKQLTDIHTFVKKLPTLDIAEEWTFNDAVGAWATRPTDTVRTKKIPRAFVKYEATPEHPAQVEMVNEDKIVGTWRTIKFSGALPQSRVKELLDRVEKLIAATKMAREEANMTPAEDAKVGKVIFDYLFA